MNCLTSYLLFGSYTITAAVILGLQSRHVTGPFTVDGRSSQGGFVRGVRGDGVRENHADAD